MSTRLLELLFHVSDNVFVSLSLSFLFLYHFLHFVFLTNEFLCADIFSWPCIRGRDCGLTAARPLPIDTNTHGSTRLHNSIYIQ